MPQLLKVVLLVSYIHLVLQTNVPFTGLLSSTKWSSPSCTHVSGLWFFPCQVRLPLSAHPFILSLPVLSMLRTVCCSWGQPRYQFHSPTYVPCVGYAPAHIAHSHLLCTLRWSTTTSECTAGQVHGSLCPDDNTLVEKVPCFGFLLYAKVFKTRERKKWRKDIYQIVPLNIVFS